MDRRDFLWTLGLGLTASAGGTRCTRTRAPNIVYVLADDLGYGDLRALNPDCRIPTPVLDQLAREGMIFTDAHSGSAVCTPTRYGILTGRYAWRSRLQSGVLWGYSAPLIEPGRITVASYLKGHGYATACVGKWHLGLGWHTLDGYAYSDDMKETGEHVDYAGPIAGGPKNLGFDYFFGIPASLDMVPYVYIENDRVVEPPTRTVPGGEGLAFHRGGPAAPGFVHAEVLPTLTRKAVAFIDRQASSRPSQPFFLYFPLSAPHTPILPAREFQGTSGIGPYGDFVHQCDWSVGEILKAVERHGLSRDSLVIFTSDNGCSPTADFEALARHGHYPSYHLRGYKADIFEGGHRIPFIARWPARVRGGSRCNDTICLTDLLATCAEILGERLQENAGEDSVSILPDLLERGAEPVREATVHHSMDGSFSIRQGHWKLELCSGSGGWSSPTREEARKQNLPKVQLYDLDQDIRERTNLHEQHPDVVERLVRLLEKYVADGRSTPGRPQSNAVEVKIWKD
ncbi:MAG: arylsulfatase [Acidobacteria bacterium]|nr:arylsulfatase [Acidobacteriota bacterium]